MIKRECKRCKGFRGFPVRSSPSMRPCAECNGTRVKWEFACLSVWQPWAWLLVNGPKTVENRTWAAPRGYRGPLLIHAAQREDAEAMLDFMRQRVSDDLPMPEMPRGAIVGVVDLVGCTKERSDFDWHEKGKVGWYVENARPFEKAIPWKGKQGMFKVNPMNVPDMPPELEEVWGRYDSTRRER